MSGSDEQTASRAAQWGASGVFTAGVLLLLAGAWSAVVGISAIAKDEVYVVGAKFVWQLNLTTWGWIQLILAALLILLGVYVLRGAHWAAITGIILAAISALANFMWLPYQPVWAILLIALNVFIIWSLAKHREAIHLLDD